MLRKKLISSLWILLVFGLLLVVPVSAQSGLDPSAPDEVVKLIFIHHSVGENWLADDHGGLGSALEANNYFVSDTNYGWGPDGIGDRTDTLDWAAWFTGSQSDTFLTALYEESDANAGGWEYYSRSLADPGGENQIIMFKSCYPNSDLGGSPNDEAAPDDWLTVASAKYTYNQLLEYFATRQDKLFVVITSPPMQYISSPENARAFNEWLVNDWLNENNYPYQNVMVFDFYNVLTHPDNHHRYNNGVIEYSTMAGSNTLYYDDNGDDHPNAAGSQKATDEFVTLLNVYYHIWQADTAVEQPADEPAEPQPTEAQLAAPEPDMLAGDGLIDDFESGPLPDSDYWMSYWDEAVETSLNCQPTTTAAVQGLTSLQIDFDVLAQSWASCELLYYSPQNWSGDGFSFYLQSSSAGMPYHILFYYQQGEDLGTSAIQLTAPDESVGQWAEVFVPWDAFAEQDSLVYPEVARGMAFIVEGSDTEGYAGTLWVDDLRLGASGQVDEAASTTADTENVVEAQDEIVEDAEVSTEIVESGPLDSDRGLPVCGNLPFIGLMLVMGIWTWRKPK